MIIRIVEESSTTKILMVLKSIHLSWGIQGVFKIQKRRGAGDTKLELH
jgi:hypothetical protein